MRYKFGHRSQERMKGVNNDLVKCAVNALSKSKYYDYTIPWMGGYRTSLDQYYIFKNGNSQLDGTTKKSYHQTGNALDIIPYKVDKTQEDKAFRYFTQLMFDEWQRGISAGIYKGILQWGGNWRNFIDKPHWQVVINK